MTEEFYKMLDTYIVDFLMQMGIPGIGLGIIMDGKPVYTKGYGYRDLNQLLPMNSDTLFAIGSITKSFAAMAIMQLHEQNIINLQDPVNKYIDFQWGTEKDPITIHHILNHSTGFPELWATHTVGFRLAGGYDVLPPMNSWESFLDFLNSASNEKLTEPGQEFLYNNETYAILAPLIEKVTGKTFPDYVKEKILQPLNMDRSTFLKEEFEKDSNAITGYLTIKGNMLPNPIPFNMYNYANGGLTSSINEMINYMLCLLEGGEFESKQIIRKSSIDDMWTEQIKIEEGKRAVKDGGYGYGWMIENDFFAKKMIYHGGDFFVSGGEVALIPEKKMGVIISMNKQPGPFAQMIARGVLAMLLGEDIQEAMPMMAKMEKLSLLSGKYQSHKGLLKIELLMESGMLLMKAYLPEMQGGTVTFPLYPKNLDKLEFLIPVLGGEMEVNVINIDPKTKQVSLMVDRYVVHKK